MTQLGQVWPVLCLLWSHGHLVSAGGGSGLLVGLAKDGKLGSGADDWDILIICIAVGAVVIFGSAAVHYLWKRHKRQKAAEAAASGMDKEKQVSGVGAGNLRTNSVGSASSHGQSPPPSYKTCVPDLEDE